MLPYKSKKKKIPITNEIAMIVILKFPFYITQLKTFLKKLIPIVRFDSGTLPPRALSKSRILKTTSESHCGSTRAG